MIRTLTGENSEALQSALRQIVADFVAEHGDLALERIDGEEVSFARLQESLTSLPFLASKKLVVLRAPGKNKQFTEEAEQLLGAVPETTDVILVEPKLDKRLLYYKFLKSNTDYQEFTVLDQPSLARWLSERAAALDGSLSTGDANYLIDRVGPNQQALTNELDKLLLYNPTINRASIDLLTDEAPQSTIFQLLEAAFGGQGQRVLQLYGEQRALKVEPQQIMAMLAWQLQVLSVIKAGGDRSVEVIAKEARLNPYVVRKSQGIARHLSSPQLKQQIRDLLQIDLKSKRTALDVDEALQNYLLALA